MAVPLAQFVPSETKPPAPGEAGLAKRLDEVLGGKASVAAVAVDERMDQHQAVMEPDGEVVGREGGGLDPGLRVSDEVTDRDGDKRPVDADVGVVLAVGAGPLPDPAEHRLVQVPQIEVIEELGGRRGAAERAFGDVLFLGFVELTECRDVGRDELESQLPSDLGLAVADRGERIADGSYLAVGPQAATIDESFGESLELAGRGRRRQLLVLQAAVVGHAAEMLSGLPAGLVLDALLEAGPRDEEVDELAVESVSSPAERAQLDATVEFAAFDVDDRRLRDPHPSGQLRARHPERIANGADPSAMGARLIEQRSQPL